MVWWRIAGFGLPSSALPLSRFRDEVQRRRPLKYTCGMHVPGWPVSGLFRVYAVFVHFGLGTKTARASTGIMRHCSRSGGRSTYSSSANISLAASRVGRRAGTSDSSPPKARATFRSFQWLHAARRARYQSLSAATPRPATLLVAVSARGVVAWIGVISPD